MRKRSLLSPDVCPSVCLSRWCIVSRRLKILLNFFLGPVATWFWIFTLSADTQFHVQLGAKCTGSGEILQFSTENRRLSRKRYEIGPRLLWNVNSPEVICGGSIGVGSDDLGWLWKAGHNVKFFRRISLLSLVSFDLERPNSAVWHVGRGVFLGDTNAPTARVRDSSATQFWRSYYYIRPLTQLPYLTW